MATKKLEIGSLDKLPEEYTTHNAAMAAWPELLQDCKIVGQYLYSQYLDNIASTHNPYTQDVQFVNVHVEPKKRFGITRSTIVENSFDRGWTIHKSFTQTGHISFEEPFKVLDGRITPPQAVKEHRVVVTQSGRTVCLTSGEVYANGGESFGSKLLLVPVVNLRSDSQEADARQIVEHLNGNEYFIQSDKRPENIYGLGLICINEQTGTVINGSKYRANMVLQGIRAAQKKYA